MARETDTSTLDTILVRTLDRLIKSVIDCTESNTYISTLSEELPPNPDEKMFEVCPSHNYQFEPGHFTGAGRNAVHTVTQILVAIHITAQMDEQGRDTLYLTHKTRGACQLLGKVLSALSGHDLKDVDGNELLSEPLRPETGYIPPKDDRKRGYVTLAFHCEFDWYIPPIEP